MKKLALLMVFVLIISTFSFLSVSAEEAAVADPNPTGDYLKYHVDIKKPEGETLTYNFTTIKLTDYVIEKGDMLEYDVKIDTEETGWGHIDGDIASIGTIRDTPAVADQNGTPIHTGQDLSADCYNKWWHRVLNLATTEDDSDKPTVGKKLTQIQVAMHPTSDTLEYSGNAYYDNIVVTNNGQVKYVIFQNATDIDTAQIKRHHDKNNETKETVEILKFTADEETQMKADLEAEKKAAQEAIEEASRKKESQEQSRVEAESVREASEKQSAEQASIDASIAANATTEAEKSDDSGSNLPMILGIVGGVVVIAVIIVIVVVTSGKKKPAGKK